MKNKKKKNMKKGKREFLKFVILLVGHVRLPSRLIYSMSILYLALPSFVLAIFAYFRIALLYEKKRVIPT